MAHGIPRLSTVPGAEPATDRHASHPTSEDHPGSKRPRVPLRLEVVHKRLQKTIRLCAPPRATPSGLPSGALLDTARWKVFLLILSLKCARESLHVPSCI